MRPASALGQEEDVTLPNMRERGRMCCIVSASPSIKEESTHLLEIFNHGSSGYSSIAYSLSKDRLLSCHHYSVLQLRIFLISLVFSMAAPQFIPLQNPPKSPLAPVASASSQKNGMGTVISPTSSGSSCSNDSPIDRLFDGNKELKAEVDDAVSQVVTPTRELPSTKLQRLIKEPTGLIVCPGVYDGLSARVALQVGFRALYMVILQYHAGIISLLRLTISKDWGRHIGESTRHGRFRTCSTSRHERPSRNDL